MKKKYNLIDLLDDTIVHAKTILEMENNIKNKLLIQFQDSDFDFSRLYIGVTNYQHFQFYTHIYSNFSTLEDAIDCCIASSHIPFITGGFVNKYHNIITFDGGFGKYPYLKDDLPKLHIYPDIWKENKSKPFIYDTSLFSRKLYDFNQLYYEGYRDAKKNKIFLDTVFPVKEY